MKILEEKNKGKKMKQIQTSGCIRLEFSGEQTIQELLLQTLVETIKDADPFDWPEAGAKERDCIHEESCFYPYGSFDG